MEPTYAPEHDNGRPDPGEVVWAWVPYEEDDGRGKDRPVLVLDMQGERLLALQLTSEDHDLDGVRREGAALDRELFEAVVGAAAAHLTF